MYCQNTRRDKDNQFTSFIIFTIMAKQTVPSNGISPSNGTLSRADLFFLRKNTAQRQGLAAAHLHQGLNLLLIDGQRFAVLLLQHLAWRILANAQLQAARDPCCSTVGVTSIPRTASLNSTEVAPLSPLET